MRVLWFNWRCIKHPLAGGAEVYTHEVARRLAARGHDIILIASRPPGLPAREIIDGYRVFRAGGSTTVYFHAWRLYRHLLHGGWRPDVVVEEINTVPFLSPLYADTPVVLLVHQLCCDCWNSLLPAPLARLAWSLEAGFHNYYAMKARRGEVSLVVTVSKSTKRDLLFLGYPEDKVKIVYNGLDWSFYSDCIRIVGEKEEGLVVYLGRITPYKRLEDLLKSWKIIEQYHARARLVIAGRPQWRYLYRLIRLSKLLGLRRVVFKPSISREEKKALLARARILVYTSTREGWGQTILEAAACKTPAVAYRVPGLCESVVDMETGILVKPGDIEALASAINLLLNSASLWTELAENAYRRSQRFSWEKTAKMFEEVIRSAAETT